MSEATTPSGADPGGRTMMLGGGNLEGTRLGNCQLQKRIGAGAMGEVWLAHHVGLNKPVAIKLLSRDLVGGPSNVQRFLREAQMAASLEHPNVVQVFDVGESQGLYYLAMQYVEGRSLDKVLEEKGRLGLPESLAYVRRIAMALGAAHKLGIVHRDIKPANVLLSKDGAIKVADFGLARGANANASLSVEGQIVGTPFYMSPEQAQGVPVDARADLYSLGATFYHFVTGRRVFEGETPISIILKHVNEAPKPPQQVEPSVPAPVAQVILKLLAKQPKDRFQSADEVVRVVASLEGGATARIAAGGPAPERILELGGESMLDLFAPTASGGSAILPPSGGESLLDLGGGAPAPPAPSGAESLFAPGGGGETLLELGGGRGAAPPPAAKPPADTKKGGLRGLDLKDNSPEALLKAEGKFVVGKYLLHREARKEKDGLSVWEGENIRSKAKVQVTLLKSDATDAIRAFYKRAAETTELKHAGILRVIEAGSDTDAKGRVIHFLAVDLVHTMPFDAVLGARMVTLKQALSLVVQVCEALEVLHRKKHLHGELTPWDLLVEPPERALIRLYRSPYEIESDPEKAKQQALAASAFMSPEQIPDVEGAPDLTTDVYRLGAILYWTAVGKAPYAATSLADMYRKILAADPPAPKSANPKIDPELDEIIRAAMNRVRELRISSVTDLAMRLRKYLKTEPKPDQPITTRKLPAKGLKARFLIFYRTHRKQTWAAALAFLLLAGGGAGYAIWTIRESAARENEFSRAFLDAIRLHREGKYSEALTAAERALALRMDPQLIRIKGECQRRSLEEAATKREAAFAQVSRRPGASDQEIQDAYGRLEAAASELGKSLTGGGGDEADPRAWAVLGETLLSLGQHEKADEALQRAMLLGDRNPRTGLAAARNWAARALLANHAVRLLAQGPKSDPRVSDWAARALDALKRPTDPVRIGREASTAELYAAAARGDLPETERLSTELTKTSAVQPPPEAIDLALIKAMAPGKLDLAELDAALAREPQHPLALVVRGVRRVEQSRLEDGSTDLNRAVQLRPKSALLLLLRAKIRYLTSQMEGVVADLSAVSVLAPPSWEYALYVDDVRRALPAQFQAPAPK